MDDLQQLVAAYRAGNLRARDRLWTSHLPLVRTVAARFPHPPAPLSPQDVADIATDALFAVLADEQKFDPSRADHVGYLRRTLTNAVLIEIRRVTARGRYQEDSVDAPIGTDGLTLGDTIADPTDGTGAAEARAMLARAYPSLLPNQRRHLALRCQGHDLEDVGRMTRRSKARAEATEREINGKVARVNAPFQNSSRKTLRERRHVARRSFRSPREEDDLIRRAATEAGVSESEWIRRACREYAAQSGHSTG